MPEVPLTAELLRGPDGYLSFLLQRVRERGHAVVVVAEGAGEELCGKSAEVDKGGNRKLPKVGVSRINADMQQLCFERITELAQGPLLCFSHILI